MSSANLIITRVSQGGHYRLNGGSTETVYKTGEKMSRGAESPRHKGRGGHCPWLRSAPQLAPATYEQTDFLAPEAPYLASPPSLHDNKMARSCSDRWYVCAIIICFSPYRCASLHGIPTHAHLGSVARVIMCPFDGKPSVAAPFWGPRHITGAPGGRNTGEKHDKQ